MSSVARLQAEGCQPALFINSFVDSSLIICSWLLSVCMYPLIYSGLLSIGIMLVNPLGSDFIDFPGSFYQHVMKSELRGVSRCVDAHNANQKAANVNQKTVHLDPLAE